MFRQLEQDLRKLGYDTSQFGGSETQSIAEIIATLPDDPVEFTQKVRLLQGKPFSFDDRPYLLPLYRDTAKEICIVKPRQMEITEFALNWLLFKLVKNPGTVGLYLSDRDIHVSAFSTLRLQSWGIAMSPILQQLAEKSHRVFRQSFKNQSHLFMHSAWGGFEIARSYPADFVVIDEIQSTDVTKIAILEETLSKSKFGNILKIGTGSIRGDPWSKMWSSGTQFEWDMEKLQWIAKNPSATIHSYHLSQYMAPWISIEKLEEKRQKYPPRQFANEVEGLWYEGMQKPLLEQDIQNLFDKNLDFTPPEKAGDWDIYIGVDWGGGIQAFTVVWIWQLIIKTRPMFRVLNIVKIDDRSIENQADQVINLIDKYQPKKVVVDAGGGARQIEKITKRFGSKVYRCVYAQDAIKPTRVNHGEMRLNVDRTWAIESVIDLITRTGHEKPYPRIQIPYMVPDKVDWIVDNFTCIEAETRLSSGMSVVSYVHNEKYNDDALHAAVYAYLAYSLHTGASYWQSI